MGNRQYEANRLVDSLPWDRTLELHYVDPLSNACAMSRYFHFGVAANGSRYGALADLNADGTGYELEVPLFTVTASTPAFSYTRLSFDRTLPNGKSETMEVRIVFAGTIPYIECVYSTKAFAWAPAFSRLHLHMHPPDS